MKTIRSIYGRTLFESEKNQTTKELLVKAINQGADLSDADLNDAYLRGADLSDAYLKGADLNDAYLRGADLRGADLRGADLRGAYLRGAYLRGAYLRGAYLRGAYLRGAYLRGAYLEIDKIKHLFQIVPEEESFIAWKKGENNCIIKLLIPKESKRHNHLSGRKCRAEFVDVLAILDNNNNKITKCQNGTNITKRIQYIVGQRTYADSYDSDPLIECSNGIHFFLTRKEAEEW